MIKTEKKVSPVVYIVLIIFSIIMLVPFVWMALTAFKSATETMQIDPFVFFPSVWRTNAFVTVIKNMNFAVLYKNTILLIFLRILTAVVTSTMAGYAFARLDFRGKNFAFALVLFQMMVPSQIFVIPQYVQVSKMGMTNHIFGLLYPGLVSAFGTFLMRQAFMGLPKDLEDAATLDGCNIGQTFFHVMLPLARSNIIALGIFTAIFAYKELMWPMIVAPSNDATTLAAALGKMQTQYTTKYPELMAASLLACLPMILIYLLFQRQFIEGIATSGGKL